MSDEHVDSTRPEYQTKKPRRTNGAQPEIESQPVSNIFDDLAALRLDPADSMAGTVEHLGHVPVRKPGKIEFVRTHPDPEMTLAASIFEDVEERESYFIIPQARPLLLGYLKPVLLVTSISRQGVLFLWPVPLPNDEAGGRTRAWGETARQAAEIARNTWVRIRGDMSLGAYRVNKAEGVLPDPVWPKHTFTELLTVAFKGRVVSNSDHPVIRKLRGMS